MITPASVNVAGVISAGAKLLTGYYLHQWWPPAPQKKIEMVYHTDYFPPHRNFRDEIPHFLHYTPTRNTGTHMTPLHINYCHYKSRCHSCISNGIVINSSINVKVIAWDIKALGYWSASLGYVPCQPQLVLWIDALNMQVLISCRVYITTCAVLWMHAYHRRCIVDKYMIESVKITCM